ncbi:MAG: acetolactate synthase large subunit [Chlamydiota bacterium]
MSTAIAPATHVMNGAQALFKALIDAGLDTCFANPGTSEMQLVYEIGLTEGVRAVLCLQENTVTGAADGYARMAGKPAFTLLHVGSGFANGIANLHNAGRAHTTMVNIVGANATYHQPRFPAHELINGRIVDLARVVSHWAQEARSAGDLAVLGALATRYSQLGAGKICTVVAPTNCHWEPAVAPPEPGGPMETPRVSPHTIDDVAALLANGKKTGLVLGSRMLYGEGLELAGCIAAKTGATLLAEFGTSRFARGEGRVPVERIPYLLERALRLLAPYEQLILVGAPFPVATFAYKDKAVVKVPEGCQVSTLATVEHDLLAAMTDLAAAVNALSEPAERQSRWEPAIPAGALTGEAIGDSICLLMPENAILVDEGITNGATVYYRTQGARAHDYLQAACGGAIGAGLPVALGAAVACPSRKTIVIEGDGSAMYTVQALWSMAREKADVVVVLLRNDSYAILEVELARVREGDANSKMLSMMHLDNPVIDWVKLAEGQGIPATRATTAAEFHEQFAEALGHKGPSFIEAQVAQKTQAIVDEVRKSK